MQLYIGTQYFVYLAQFQRYCQFLNRNPVFSIPYLGFRHATLGRDLCLFAAS